MNDERNRPRVPIRRTVEGTIFEIVCGLLLLALWLLSLWAWKNGQGVIEGQLLTNVIGTVVVVLCLVCAYSPDMINVPVNIVNERQTWMLVRLDRVVGVEMCLMFLGLNLVDILDLSGTGIILFNLGFLVLLLLTIIVGSVKIARMRR